MSPHEVKDHLGLKKVQISRIDFDWQHISKCEVDHQACGHSRYDYDNFRNMLLGSWDVVHTHTDNEWEQCREGDHKELRHSLGRLCQIVNNVDQDHTSPQKHD